MSLSEMPKSLDYVHEKIAGKAFTARGLKAIVSDVNQGFFSGPQIAAFLTASAAQPLSTIEILSLTKAMIVAGPCLQWDVGPILDKHCIGGLPGNRTTPIIVSVLAALGLRAPKTSSRAIKSAAGTADVMEVLAPVHLTIEQMKSVVEKVGGCIVWGGAVGLSPVDDELVRIAREIGIDAEGQLVSSILSKKIAAGSTHLIVDIPFGPTAKIETEQDALRLKDVMLCVAHALGLACTAELTDGTEPVGFGIGPALEARDVIAVLQNLDSAPVALRDRAIFLAGKALELSGEAESGIGHHMAYDCLSSGKAWEKFQQICEAQGGMRDIPNARYTHCIAANTAGFVEAIDNKRLVRLARLAGAPEDKAAGLDLHAETGMRVQKAGPLYTIHSNSQSGLKLALNEGLSLCPFTVIKRSNSIGETQ